MRTVTVALAATAIVAAAAAWWRVGWPTFAPSVATEAARWDVEALVVGQYRRFHCLGGRWRRGGGGSRWIQPRSRRIRRVAWSHGCNVHAACLVPISSVDPRWSTIDGRSPRVVTCIPVRGRLWELDYAHGTGAERLGGRRACAARCCSGWSLSRVCCVVCCLGSYAAFVLRTPGPCVVPTRNGRRCRQPCLYFSQEVFSQSL